MNDSSSARVVDALRTWVGSAAPGAQLPSTRALVAEHGVSPVTVQKALRALAAQGVVESRPGVGTFVRLARTHRPADHGWQTAALGAPRADLPGAGAMLRSAAPETHALHVGYPDEELLPARLVRAGLTRAARGAAATVRPPSAGLEELRAWFAGELAELTPAGQPAPTAHDVLVTPGTQGALTSVFRALVAPGETLLVESPTYWGALLAARQAGVRVVPVPADADGPEPDGLDRAFRETGARAFYAQPTYANPTGASWTTARAEQVLDVVVAHGAFLVEDDWARDLGIDESTPPHQPLATRDPDGHVVHIRSLTKSMSPTIRVGAVVARGPVRDRVQADRAAETLYTSALLQQAALEVLTDPGWRTHLRRLRGQLRQRRDLLLAALAEHAPSLSVERVPVGGIHLWVRLPDGADVARVVAGCEARGVLVGPGDDWYPTEPAGPYLRLTFTGPGPGGFGEACAIVEETVRAQA
ncbi:MAG: GntR family transcriptional regulator [Nocardioides sp.]|nr:GntR family transcriptional regulator [Nocardioides sp.]